MDLMDEGALIREIPAVETVTNQELLEEWQQRLLPSPPETVTQDRGSYEAPEEDEIFQQYMAADEAQRREIDRLAEEKMETMQAVLDQVGPDKHQAILVQARIEVARTVLGGAESAQSEGGEENVDKGE